MICFNPHKNSMRSALLISSLGDRWGNRHRKALQSVVQRLAECSVSSWIYIYMCACVCRGHATESKGDTVYNKDRDGGVILDPPFPFMSTCPLQENSQLYPEHISMLWPPLRPLPSPALAQVKVKVAQLCPTLWDSMGCIVHGILQARILEWVAFPFSRGSSQPRDQTQVSHIANGFFTSWATREAQEYWSG